MVHLLWIIMAMYILLVLVQMHGLNVGLSLDGSGCVLCEFRKHKTDL